MSSFFCHREERSDPANKEIPYDDWIASLARNDGAGSFRNFIESEFTQCRVLAGVNLSPWNT